MTDTLDRAARPSSRDDRYPFASIEPSWRDRWANRRAFDADRGDGEPFYALEMFPYPSGDLHWGHVRNYTIGDVAARYRRMRGRRVLHPMGWDAFGLPAENAAIARNVHPAEWTRHNIGRMRDQFRRMGFSYDWSKELNTASPEYYRWTQWLFLQLYKSGLAYKKNAPVNWCPSCLTALANEQVHAGECERCGSAVTKKLMNQWFFRITRYADRLLEGHATLDWPEDIVTMQRNWIGRSTGAEVVFKVEGTGDEIPVFTTRPDTLFGVTYLVLAPEHPLVESLTRGTKREAQASAFVERMRRQTEIERTATDAPKEGVDLGAFAINPADGQAVPIWTANYVLLEYGTGAVMAVPAHDARDFEFAHQYGLSILDVVEPPGRGDREPLAAAFTGAGVMVNSGPFNGMPSDEGKGAVTRWLEERGAGRATISYRLRDWLISRQRYWGAPIPILYCDRCDELPVPEECLPVELPLDVRFTGQGESPLASSASFAQAPCPACGGAARRDLDTMDTFVDSAWYYLRFPSAGEPSAAWTPDSISRWLPVDQYIGGREHATMHLIYARFMTMALHDLGLLPFDEPFKKLFNQGILYKNGRKLSKRDNVIAPDKTCDAYGVDTARCHVLFLAPPGESAEWTDQGIEGIWRFLNRIWRHVSGQADRFQPDWARRVASAAAPADASVRRRVHQTVERVTDDMERLHFNTSISSMMELVNELYQTGDACSDSVWSEAVDRMVRMLGPFAPYLASELWERIGGAGELESAGWPEFDPALTLADEVEVVFQVNGKVRDRARVPPGIAADALERLARENPRVVAAVGDGAIRKAVVVPGRLVNLVVG